MKLLIVGDIHGAINSYWKLLSRYPKRDLTVHLGDFGFKAAHDWHSSTLDSKTHKVLMGNHDYYPYQGEKEHILPRYGVLEQSPTIFYMCGAYSIDKRKRTIGFDWWEEEELLYEEFEKCRDLYVSTKPRIVLTHDCPSVCRDAMFPFTDKRGSRTEYFLEELFSLHKPEQWYFGHFHKSVSQVIEGTYFECLDILQPKMIEVQ